MRGIFGKNDLLRSEGSGQIKKKESERVLPFSSEERVSKETEGAFLPLSVRGLTVSYGGKPVLFSVDAVFQEANLCALIGPNGAGKSSFLKAVLGIVRPLSGHVRIYGLPLQKARHRIAYVPQRASVDWEFPTSVLDVVLMGQYRSLGMLRPVTAQARARARSCLEKVGMAAFETRQIGQLSGGQQQRVFLARALAQEAQLYLLDEPFAGVDAATESVLIAVLTELKQQGASIVCVHHDLTTLRSYFDSVLLLNVTKIAQGAVQTVLTRTHLQETYGGRLAPPYLDQLTLVG